VVMGEMFASGAGVRQWESRGGEFARKYRRFTLTESFSPRKT